MSSNNESLLNNESLSRATYFNAAQLQQQQYQYQLQQQQQQLLNYQHNNYSTGNYNQLNNIQHIQQQHHSLHHHQQQQQQQQIYQHQPLTNVFPSIYSDTTNYNLKNMSNNMTSSSGGSSTTSVPAAAAAASTGGVTSTSHYSSVQRQIQQDWSNREYIEIIILNIKKLTDFLNSFELSCRSKMAMLDEKLTKIERQIDFVEAKVTKGETLN